MFNPRLIAAASAMLFLTACSSGLFDHDSGSSSSTSTSGSGGGLGGLFDFSAGSGPAMVVGDEPFAVRAGASVLTQGGSAADAASAMYFALAVTYPVAAALGAGGICVVHDPSSGRNETFNFLARDPAGGGDYAVPGAVKGFALMQSVYGRLPWQRVVSPAEALAGTGFPITQALDARLRSAQNIIRLDADLAAEFLDESGNVKPAGSVVFNRGLANTLSAIREQGPSGFYSGAIAQEIAAYSAAQGGGPSVAELGAYTVSRAPAQVLNIGDGSVYLPPADLGTGEFQAKLFSQLMDADGHPVADLAPAVAQAIQRTLRDFGITTLPEDLGSTGFAATDASGQAVACAVTMNGPFGSGHTVQGTGITLAEAPSKGQTGLAAAFLAPAIATPPDGSLALAGAGAGGPNGTAAMAYVLMRLANGEDVTKPGELKSTGIAPYDTVNVITCDEGICAVLPDPGGHGMGAVAATP